MGSVVTAKKSYQTGILFQKAATGLLMALVFVVTFNLGSELFIIVLYEVITLCLITICFADMKYEIIPLSVVITASLASGILLYFISPTMIMSHIFAALGAGAFFLLIFLVTRGRGMGFGDVIFSFFMGLLLGFPQILFGLYITFILGAAISLGLIAFKKKKLHGGTIPFGPFLVLGTFTMMIWGEAIMHIFASYLT